MARIRAPFDKVVSALRPNAAYSNVYVEVLKTNPRVAVAVGENFFFMAGNYLAITMLLIEEGATVLAKAVATGGRRGPLDLFDLGSSKDYTLESLEDLCRAVNAECQVLKEVEYLDATKSERLY
ncbi:MAG: DUF6054 family protein [Zestosphaera sp.]